jgi:hypothetical protein
MKEMTIQPSQVAVQLQLNIRGNLSMVVEVLN